MHPHNTDLCTDLIFLHTHTHTHTPLSHNFRIGPFATGAIQALTGEFRTGFWFPLSLLIVGGGLLYTIDMNKGKDEAMRYRADQEAKRRLLASIPPITITHAGESPFMSRSVLLEL